MDLAASIGSWIAPFGPHGSVKGALSCWDWCPRWGRGRSSRFPLGGSPGQWAESRGVVIHAETRYLQHGDG